MNITRDEALRYLNMNGWPNPDSDFEKELIDTMIEFANGVVKNNIALDALKILRDLAEFQNGAPLVRYEKEYNKTMAEVWDFLEANEPE